MKPGRPRAPRRRLGAALREALCATHRTRQDLARASGFRHEGDLSVLINADDVPATPLTCSRLRMLAVVLGLRPDDVFADESGTRS